MATRGTDRTRQREFESARPVSSATVRSYTTRWGTTWARRGWFDKVVGYEDINCVRRQHKSSIHTDVRKLLVGHQPSNTTN